VIVAVFFYIVLGKSVVLSIIGLPCESTKATSVLVTAPVFQNSSEFQLEFLIYIEVTVDGSSTVSNAFPR
jgi:hypothetical protein